MRDARDGDDVTQDSRGHSLTDREGGIVQHAERTIMTRKDRRLLSRSTTSANSV